jgi:2-polyprenyl-3-methyl-5-hydroxy-6-metoxy-1,4-benzoquinol methylase
VDGETRQRVAANRAYWDELVPVHVASDYYDHDGFLAGRCSLQPWELDEVGDVSGKHLVHLQCHFGHDTISWARRGARATGIDFSRPAIEQARRTAEALGVDVRFVVSDVGGAQEALGGATFDVVYTSHGVLTWLPDIDRWSATVASLLRPGGFAYISEFHPLLWVVDDEEPRLGGDYFQTKPVRYEEPGSYAARDAPTEANVTYEWQHTLADIVSALTFRGLAVEMLRERPFTLWNCLAWLERRDDGTWWPVEGAPRIPLMFSLRARRPA